jgi:hypothetical protein
MPGRCGEIILDGCRMAFPAAREFPFLCPGTGFMYPEFAESTEGVLL